MESPQLDKDGDLAMRPPKTRSKLMRYIIGALMGGILGFGYYKLVGCSTGTCPLTSNPWTSTIYGMVMGSMIAGTSG